MGTFHQVSSLCSALRSEHCWNVLEAVREAIWPEDSEQPEEQQEMRLERAGDGEGGRPPGPYGILLVHRAGWEAIPAEFWAEK